MDIMSAVSSRSGELSEIDLQEINNFEASEHFSDLEKAVIQYATEMSLTPVRISEDVFAILKSNFSEKQLVELTASIGWENYRARFNHAFGLGSAEFHREVVVTSPS